MNSSRRRFARRPAGRLARLFAPVVVVGVSVLGAGTPFVSGAGAQPAQLPSDGSIAAPAPVRIVPLEGSTLTVGSTQTAGAVELVPTERGTLDVVEVTTVGAWLRSLAPGPAGARNESAEAQAIAWRTYALRRIGESASGPGAGPADVCSHVGCPIRERVGLLADTAAGPEGGLRVDAVGGPDDGTSASASGSSAATTRPASWSEAVDATRDMVVRSGGAPALTRSHERSGGTTRANEAVFEDGTFGYLRPVDVKDDESAASAPSRWSAVLSVADVDKALRAATLSVPPSLTEVRTVGGDDDPQVALIGDGTEVRLSKSTFADALDAVRSDGAERPNADLAPERARIVPSYRFAVTTSGDDVRIEGSGEGHGVGLSATASAAQAENGSSSDDILRRFYPGTDTAKVRDADAEELRVAVAEAPVVTLDSTRGFRIVAADGKAVVDSALLQWTARAAEPSTTLDPGVVAFTTPDSTGAELGISGFSVPLQGTAGAGIPVAFVLTRPAFVTALLTDAKGEATTVPLDDGKAFPSGRSTTVVRIATAGTWKIRLVADDKKTTVRTGTQSLTVDERRRGPSRTGLLALTALLAGIVIVTFIGRIAMKRRRRDRAA